MIVVCLKWCYLNSQLNMLANGRSLGYVISNIKYDTYLVSFKEKTVV